MSPRRKNEWITSLEYLALLLLVGEAVPGNPEGTLKLTISLSNPEFIVLLDQRAPAFTVSIQWTVPSPTGWLPQPETQAFYLTPAQCPGRHCNSSILLHSFCLLLGIQIPYSINSRNLFLGPLPPASSAASLQSILYSATRDIFLIILLSYLILQRLPIAHRIKAKSPLAGFPPGSAASTAPCHSPFPAHIHSEEIHLSISILSFWLISMCPSKLSTGNMSSSSISLIHPH